MKTGNFSSHGNQRGTVLVITLLLLVVMTLIVLSGSRNTTLQLRMASNLQAKTEAIQKAQSAIDDIIANYKATDFQDNDKFICTEKNKSGAPPCNTFKATNQYLQLHSNYLDSTTTSWVEIVRVQDKIDLTGFTIKAGFKGAGGGSWFGTGYEITSGYDGTGTGQGKAVLKVGAIKLSRE